MSPKLHSSGPVPHPEELQFQPLPNPLESRRRTRARNQGLNYLRSRPPQPPESREAALHSLSSLEEGTLHFRSWGRFPGASLLQAFCAPDTGKGSGAPGGREGGRDPPSLLWLGRTRGAEPLLQAAPPPKVGRRQPESPDTRSAHALQGPAAVTRQRFARRRLSQRRDLGSLGFVSPRVQKLGSSSLPPHGCAHRRSVLWPRPLESGGVGWGGANLSGTRWPRPPGPWTAEALSCCWVELNS